MDQMWAQFRVRWEFVSRLYASVPADPEMRKRWLEARAPKHRPPQSKSLDEIAQEVYETMAEPPEAEDENEHQMLVFQRIVMPTGITQLAMRAATVRAHLKDCAMQVQTYVAGAVQGERAFATRVKNCVYPPARHPLLVAHRGTPFIPLYRIDGAPITQADSVQEKAVHIITPQGPRSAIKSIEFVEDAAMTFPLHVLRQPTRNVNRKETDPKTGKTRSVLREQAGKLVVSESDLKTMMLYGGVHGYAGERSEDGGRYAFDIVEEDA